MALYDCHAHLADERLWGRAEAEIARFVAAGGAGILVAAARHVEWERVAQLSESRWVLGALGVHPFFHAEWDSGSTRQELLGKLRGGERLVAVGEIGLDFYHGRHDAEAQIRVFGEQLALAVDLDLPVVFHNRRSWPDFLGLLRELCQPVRGVCHNFTGSRELAREILDAGLHISFAGPVTYPNARRAHESARYVPADRLLVETDAPDLPVWSRSVGSCSSPIDVGVVLAQLAHLRGVPTATLGECVARSFAELFGVRTRARSGDRGLI
jgi:TatD DNase family protein